MKKNLIKTSLCTLVFTLLLSLQVVGVYAASFSVSKSKSSVSPGGTFTVSISANGAGQFSVSASNGSVSSGSVWVDGSGSVSVTAGSSGTTTVTVSAVDATGYDESPITGSKSVSVSIKSSSSSNQSAAPQVKAPVEQKKEDTRSKVNTLSSLSVSSGTLSPKFSSSQTTYTVNLTSDVESLDIKATATDSKAKVSGTGTKALKIGTQAFEIVCTAENGSKKSYTINVNVEEKPTVFTQFGDKKLGVLKQLSGVKAPEGYKGTTIQLEGQDVNAWVNEAGTMTLVYLMDEDGNKNFYVVEDGKISGQYQVITVLSKQYTLLSIPESMKEQDNLVSSKVKIGDVEIEGWKFEDKKLNNYSVVYLMNDAGKKSLYVYEGTEGTLQLYTEPTKEGTPVSTYIFIATTVVFAVGCGVLGFMLYKGRKEEE